MKYVVLYLAAIVAANLLVAEFGPSVVILNAFLFIGLDLTTRDALHERWHGRHLWLKMAGLIAAGSLLSWFLNRDAGRIAMASFIAFAGAGLADTVVYHLLHGRARLLKVNGSNVVSAAVDSVLFPLIAFGWPPLLGIMAGQFVAKIAGGALWSMVLLGRKWKGVVTLYQSKSKPWKHVTITNTSNRASSNFVRFNDRSKSPTAPRVEFKYASRFFYIAWLSRQFDIGFNLMGFKTLRVRW